MNFKRVSAAGKEPSLKERYELHEKVAIVIEPPCHLALRTVRGVHGFGLARTSPPV